MAIDASQITHRPYFTPSKIDPQLERSQRRCVEACLARLGTPRKMSDGPQCVMWCDILDTVCPNEMKSQSFKNLKDLKDRAGDNLDQLYVAVVNQVMRGTNHAMLIWKEKNNSSNQFILFSPGNHKSEKTINILNERDVANWNLICAVFISGTVVRKSDDVTIDLS